MNDDRDILARLERQNERLLAVVEMLSQAVAGNGTAPAPTHNQERPQPMLNRHGQFEPEPLRVLPDGTIKRPTTLVDYMRQWFKGRESKRDLYNEVNRFETHIATHEPFATLPIHELRDIHIEDFLRDLSAKRSEQTVRHVFRLIRQALGDALKRHAVAHNPATGVKVPKQTTTEDPWTYLQPAEIRQLLDSPALTDEQRHVFGVAIFTGLRRGELTHLQWSDVHLDGDRPHVVVRYSNGGAAKAGKLGRTPLLPPAIEHFRGIMAARGPGACTGLVWPASDGTAHGKGYDWGWRDRNGRPGAKTSAGIARSVRFHDLRHTCAAALISGFWGEPWSIEETKEFMRHSDIKVTQRYAHLDPTRLHAKAARMAGGISAGVSEGTKPAADGTALQVSEIIGRPHGDSNPGYRRERPTAQIINPGNHSSIRPYHGNATGYTMPAHAESLAFSPAECPAAYRAALADMARQVLEAPDADLRRLAAALAVTVIDLTK